MTLAHTLGAESPGAENVRWTYDPWRERPAVARASAGVGVLLCALVVATREPAILKLALCIACVAALSPAIARVECTVDAEGAARRGPLGWERRAWDRVRRVDDLPSGVLLSPYPARRWLDASRAIVLPMPASRRAALAAEVRRLWEHHGG